MSPPDVAAQRQRRVQLVALLCSLRSGGRSESDAEAITDSILAAVRAGAVHGRIGRVSWRLGDDGTVEFSKGVRP